MVRPAIEKPATGKNIIAQQAIMPYFVIPDEAFGF